MPGELLLATTAFPYRAEFLDLEIWHLAEQFDAVRIVPLRPTGAPVCKIPGNAFVDLSLAHSITPNWRPIPEVASRNAVRLFGAAASVLGEGLLGEIRNHGDRVGGFRARSAWLRRLAIAYGTFHSVATWASEVPAPDLAYSYWLGPTVIGFRHAWPRTPVVSRAHRFDLYLEAHVPPGIPMHERAVGMADRVYSVSGHGTKYLKVLYPDSTESICHRRLGCGDLGGLTPASADGTIRVISVSNVIGVKRVDGIAEAVGSLAHAGHRVEWTHLGAGPGDGRLTSTLRDVAHPNLTIQRPGAVPLDDVHAVLRRGPFDVFVNNSESEGVPVSLMEAQSAGIPIVATLVGGTSEVLTAHDVGLAVDARPDELAQSILVASKMGDQQREEKRGFWATNYDANVNAASFARELADVARAGRRGE